MLDYIVYIGRFQPFHNGHTEVLRVAKTKARKVILLIGGYDEPRTIKDPWTYEERVSFIPPEILSDVIIRPIYDFKYNDAKWTAEVISLVNSVVEQHTICASGFIQKNAKIGFICHEDDYSGYDVTTFPDWVAIPISEKGNVRATKIREVIFDEPHCNKRPENIHTHTWKLIMGTWQNPSFNALRDMYRYKKYYWLPYENVPFKPILQTVDNFITDGKSVLLIKRKGTCGNGQWALPGGFVEYGDTLIKSAKRELKEETNISVSTSDYTLNVHMFCSPNRSSLGHVITHVFVLDIRDFPKNYIETHFTDVKAGDDADDARYWKFEDITRSMMHDDHYHIIDKINKEKYNVY